MMIIPPSYAEMKHPVLKDVCMICKRKFEVGDSIKIVPIQESESDQEFTSEAVVLHTDCHYVE